VILRLAVPIPPPSEPPPIVAPAAPEAPPPTGVTAWLLGSNASGTWGGARTWLQEHGVTVDLSYTGELFGNLRGGLADRAVGAYHGSIDLGLTLDTEKLGAWAGGKLYLLAQNEHGQGISDRYVGALQSVSNLEAPPLTQLSELWYEHQLWGGLLTLRFGKQDANRDFASPRYGGNFINNAFGALPNVPMPSYPTPGLGGVILVEPSRYLILRAGAYEGHPVIGSLGFDSAAAPHAGVFTIASVGIRHTFGADRRHGGVTNLGLWHHDGVFPEISADPRPRDLSGNTGVTLVHDEHVYAHPRDRESSAGAHLFFRLSLAQPSRNNTDRYLGGGLTYHGFPWRDNDTVGVGVGTLHVQLPHPGARRDGTELFVETFYKARLTPWLSLEPDLQLFHHPGGEGRDAVVGGGRFKVKL
jgi:porin